MKIVKDNDNLVMNLLSVILVSKVSFVNKCSSGCGSSSHNISRSHYSDISVVPISQY